jgi:hypothetical protein
MKKTQKVSITIQNNMPPAILLLRSFDGIQAGKLFISAGINIKNGFA